MENFKQISKEVGMVLLFAAVLLALTLLIALTAGLISGRDILDTWWRLCSFAGAVLLLLAALLLLTNRIGYGNMKLWKGHFPHLPFTGAVVLTGGVMLAVAGVVNLLISY